MPIINEISKNIINLPRYAKRTIIIVVDLGLCVLCTWLAFYLRLEQFIKINDVAILAALTSITLAIPTFWLLGLYKVVFRFGGSSLIFAVTVAMAIYGLFYFLVIGVYTIQNIPRSIGIIQPLLLLIGILSSRVTIQYLFLGSFLSKNFKNKNKKKVLIYGAGSAGRQLLTSLENNLEMKVVGL